MTRLSTNMSHRCFKFSISYPCGHEEQLPPAPGDCLAPNSLLSHVHVVEKITIPSAGPCTYCSASSAGPGHVYNDPLDVGSQTRLLAAEFMLRAHMLDEQSCTNMPACVSKSVKGKDRKRQDESLMQADEMPFDADVRVSTHEGLSRRVRHLEGVLRGGWVVVSGEDDTVRLVRPRFDNSEFGKNNWKTMAEKMQGVMDEEDILRFGTGFLEETAADTSSTINGARETIHDQPVPTTDNIISVTMTGSNIPLLEDDSPSRRPERLRALTGLDAFRHPFVPGRLWTATRLSRREAAIAREAFKKQRETEIVQAARP